MAQELSYVMVNPYTMYKARTGGVLSRLLTRSTLDLAGGLIISPTRGFVEEMAGMMVTEKDAVRRGIQEQIRDYLLANYAPDANGRAHRAMVLLFRGDNAIARTRDAVGHIQLHEQEPSFSGETVRDTYGDFIYDVNGKVRYFEPAVLTAPSLDDARRQLQLIARHIAPNGGLLEGVAPTHGKPGHQRTLVIIKPDNFRFPSGRPGNVMDMFSKTGLVLTGMKVHRLTVDQAERFYGPVREMLRDKLREPTAQRVKELVQSALALPISAEVERQLGDLLGPIAGEEQFETIVKFMAGRGPRECSSPAERTAPGTEKCIILVYEGIDVVRKIREVLGPTDPAKAPPGSIRREFGQTMMVNAAHASDSPENAEREIGIVEMRENNFKALIQEAYGL